MNELKQKKDIWGYLPFTEWIWRDYNSPMIKNIDEFVNRHSTAQFYIGTDSKTRGKRCVMTTALVAYHLGKGGDIIIHTQKIPGFQSLRQQLIAEAMRSLETAWYIDPKIPEQSTIAIHLDVNSNLKWRSGQYRDELVGMIMAQGFHSAVKPDAWAASQVADRKCNH